MSRGRHTRPRATGGGLSAFLAIAVAGGAVALAATEPSGRVLRLCVVGVALISSFQLLMLTRTQRSSSRSLARTDDRLRTLEQRNRDEGDELHRRVLDGVAREGELRRAVEVLVDEIGRLRRSLEGFIPLVPAAPAEPAPPVEPAVDNPMALDIPLIQRVLAAQEEVGSTVPTYAPAAEPAAAPAPAGTPLAEPAFAPAAAATAPPVPAAGDLWRAPARPEYVPASNGSAAPEPAPEPVQVPVTSWVVRELQLEEPGAAVAMRILDLTTPVADETPAADHEPTSTWSAFARPA